MVLLEPLYTSTTRRMESACKAAYEWLRSAAKLSFRKHGSSGRVLTFSNAAEVADTDTPLALDCFVDSGELEFCKNILRYTGLFAVVARVPADGGALSVLPTFKLMHYDFNDDGDQNNAVLTPMERLHLRFMFANLQWREC